MIKHLSNSSIDSYFRCGKAWKKRYIDKIPSPASIPLLVGSAVHKAIEINEFGKCKGYPTMTQSEIQDAATDEIKSRIKNEGVFIPPAKSGEAHNMITTGIDEVSRMAITYATSLEPLLNPLDVEIEFYLDLGLAVPLKGYIDIICPGWLMDVKTSKNKWAESKAARSDQFTIYREAFKQLMGTYPEKITVEVLTKGKTSVHQSIPIVRDSTDIEIVKRKAEVMIKGVEAGIFMPAETGSWMCSASACTYWNGCDAIPNRLK